VRRDNARESRPSTAYAVPFKVRSCIKRSEWYMARAKRPSMNMPRPKRSPHQAPHRRVSAERHQRAEIPIDVWQQRLTAQPALDLAGQMGSLLVSGLRPRRHGGELAAAGAGSAVADRKNVGVARGLQCRLDDQLVDAVDLEVVEMSQYLRRLHTRCPHDQFRRNERAVGQG